MSSSIETQILKSEERLRLAMLESDIVALDEILATELIFTNHLGQVLNKQDDLNGHRSGRVNIKTVHPSEEVIQLMGDVAVVSVQMHIVGSYNETLSEGEFRFTRVWRLSSGGIWQIIAAHSSLIA